MATDPMVTFRVPEGGSLEQGLLRYAAPQAAAAAEQVAVEPITPDDSGRIDIGGSGGVIVMTLPSLADIPRQQQEIIDALTSASEETGHLVVGVESGAGLGEEHVHAALEAAMAANRDVIVAVRDDG